jgi:hypothetical protein
MNEEGLEEPGALGGCETVSPEDILGTDSDSLIGKLKSYCPSFFLSFLYGNETFLEKSVLLHKYSLVVTDKIVDPVDKGAPNCGDDRTPMPQYFIASNVSSSVASLVLSTLEKNSPSLPPSTLPVSEPSLDSVIDTLIPSLRETTSPIPLQTFWGTKVFVNSGCDIRREPNSEGEDQGRKLAWSRGLGSEVSPIKTRSARKKQELCLSTIEQPSTTTLDLGALRGMKSLARDKS